MASTNVWRGVAAGLLAAALLPASARAGQVVTAASCSAAHVQAALDQAADGDVVEVPAGSCTWSQTVQIRRAVHLRGAGAALTRITKSGGGRALVVSAPTSPDHLLRVSGFTFDGQGTATCIYWQNHRVPAFRIDHNAFTRCNTRAIEIYGYSSGVIDHNAFQDNGRSDIVIYGDDEAAWARPIVLGGDDGVIFVEDNTFRYTRAAGSAEHAISSNTGARYVFRYNTIDAEYHPDMHVGAPLDAHGYCFWRRGTVSYEIYGNVIRSERSYRGMFLRGGTGVVFDNVFEIPDGGCAFSSCYGIPIALTNYRSCQSCAYGGRCTSYPCTDQIRDLYVWNNTYDGRVVQPEVASCASDHVRLGRDFFTAPMSGYVPYPYPHPFVAGETLRLEAAESPAVADIGATVDLAVRALEGEEAVAGLALTWSAPDGLSAAVLEAEAETDADGWAAARVRLGPDAGVHTYTVTAEAEGQGPAAEWAIEATRPAYEVEIVRGRDAVVGVGETVDLVVQAWRLDPPAPAGDLVVSWDVAGGDPSSIRLRNTDTRTDTEGLAATTVEGVSPGAIDLVAAVFARHGPFEVAAEEAAVFALLVEAAEGPVDGAADGAGTDDESPDDEGRGEFEGGCACIAAGGTPAVGAAGWILCLLVAGILLRRNRPPRERRT